MVVAPPGPSHALSRWLFLRALGAVTVVAFASFAVQSEGLIGPRGILPYQPWLEAVGHQLGDEAFWRAPTILWWAPGSLDAVVWVGGGAALLVAVGVPMEGPLLLVAWVCYLSISTVAQRFLGFQWDTLLTETLFTAWFVARWSPWSHAEPSRVGMWLVRLLLVKLMWLAGAVKLASGDPGWWDGMAMTYHYETQPLPNPISWYAHHLPVVWHRLETWLTVAIEMLLPLAVFLGRRGRHVGALGFVLVMAGLMTTGNYGFFQLLTLVLCLSWVDDTVWRRVLPGRWVRTVAEGPSDKPRWSAIRDGAFAMLGALIVGSGALQGAWRLGYEPPVPEAVAAGVQESRAFRTVNSYGLFANMTETRPEVRIEVSENGVDWVEWPLRYKPGSLDRMPPQVAPHMPRLDWQLWFAALSDCRRNPWVSTLMVRLAEGVPEVEALMGPYPLAVPPRFLRAQVAQYAFTEPGSPEARAGHWWVAGPPRPYCPVVSVPR